MDETKIAERIQELRVKLSQLDGEEQRLRSELGSGVLDGKDVTKPEKEMALVNVRREGLDLAIRSAEEQLVKLREENRLKELGRVSSEIRSILDAVKGEVLDAVGFLEELHEKQKSWGERLERAYNLAYSYELKELEGKVQVLRGNIPNVGSVVGEIRRKQMYTGVSPVDAIQNV
jgi:multidrug efflux pump subunit AcrA (membrane-fusion protein)